MSLDIMTGLRPKPITKKTIRTKISRENAQAIWDAYKQGVKQKDIAAMFGVDVRAVRMIQKGESYKDIDRR